MILQTERLELVPLLPYQLKLWVENIPKLEKDLNCSYHAEPMEGLFLEIVKGQLEKTTRKRTSTVLPHNAFCNAVVSLRKDGKKQYGGNYKYFAGCALLV